MKSFHRLKKDVGNAVLEKYDNKCTKCGSKDIDYATRVIGYLRKVTNFSKERQLEESNRYYHKGE